MNCCTWVGEYRSRASKRYGRDDIDIDIKILCFDIEWNSDIDIGYYDGLKILEAVMIIAPTLRINFGGLTAPELFWKIEDATINQRNLGLFGLMHDDHTNGHISSAALLNAWYLLRKIVMSVFHKWSGADCCFLHSSIYKAFGAVIKKYSNVG